MVLAESADQLPVCGALLQLHGRPQPPLTFLSPLLLNPLVTFRSLLLRQKPPEPLCQSLCPPAKGVAPPCPRHHSGCSHPPPRRESRENSNAVAPHRWCQARSNGNDTGRNEGGSNPSAAENAEQPCRRHGRDGSLTSTRDSERYLGFRSLVLYACLT